MKPMNVAYYIEDECIGSVSPEVTFWKSKTMHQEITYIYISFIVVYFAQLHSLLCSHFIHELVQESRI